MEDIKEHEYALLNEIAQDSLVTQANLSQRLGIAVGSVNWYIKRLVSRGWIKVSHLDRTRLRYDLTSEGMTVFTQRAMQYAKDSLKVYKQFRQQARTIVDELSTRGISIVSLEGSDEIMDILRLTCLEAGIEVDSALGAVTVDYIGQEYTISGHEKTK